MRRREFITSLGALTAWPLRLSHRFMIWPNLNVSLPHRRASRMVASS